MIPPDRLIVLIGILGVIVVGFAAASEVADRRAATELENNSAWGCAFWLTVEVAIVLVGIGVYIWYVKEFM